MNDLRSILEAQPFIMSLDPQHRAEIEECAHEVEVEAGTFFLREGDSANHFYIITKGEVALEVHAPGRGTIIIETLGPGDVLGWSWLFPPYRWHFDVRVLTNLHVVVFDGRCIRGKCESNPALGYQLMERFAQIVISRLQAARLRLLDFYGTSAQNYTVGR